MKNVKLFLATLLVTISTTVFAQGNLQYNQAKLISSQDTVPAGKVWKMESILYSSEIADFGYPYSNTIKADKILMNNNEVVIRKSVLAVAPYSNAPGSILWEQKFPLWLPAGTSLAASTGVLYINVLEFNSVP